MKNATLYLILLYVIIVFISSCGRRCEEPFDIRDSGIPITFIDKESGNYLYPENTNTTKYNLDSFKAYDQNGVQLIVASSRQSSLDNPREHYYQIEIGPLYIPQFDMAAFHKEIEKKIFLQYDYKTRDTLNISYKASKTRCGSLFKYLNVFYRNELVGSTENKVSISITINE